jgi:hypothetical protein
MSCGKLGDKNEQGAADATNGPAASGGVRANLRGVVLRRCPTTGWHVDKIMTNGRVEPAKPGKDVDEIVQWLNKEGYEERGAVIGDDEQLAVMWLQRGDEPELLTEAVKRRVSPATVRYIPGERRFATTRTRAEIKRSRRRAPNSQADLAFIREPTLEEREIAWGLRPRPPRE